MKLKINRYSVFYFLFICFLLLLLLPRGYILWIPYNAAMKPVLAFVFTTLLFITPIYAIVLLVKELLKKRYNIFLIHLVMIISLTLLGLYLIRLGWSS